jgi:DNA polymerase (family 10)
MHTLWSDGEATIEQMADAAIGRNYECIAITDHAKGLKIAGGIDEKQLAHQAAEITSLNEKLRAGGYSLRVLQSIELNLKGGKTLPVYVSFAAGIHTEARRSVCSALF